MRITKVMAVAASGCALAASVALPAAAGASHTSHSAHVTHAARQSRPALTHGTLHSSISSTKAHNGTKLTLKVTGAKKKTTYLCLYALVKGAKYNYPDVANHATVMSSKKGKFKCSVTFHPFSGSLAGVTRHCPLTKADKKAKVICGFAAADPADQNSNAFWKLKVS